MTATPETLTQAREQFVSMVDSVRPELHRYCARLTGSVIEGEDIVQDTLAKAFYALSLSPEVPALRPWLFRKRRIEGLCCFKRRKFRFPRGLDIVAQLIRQPSSLKAAVIRQLW